MDFPSHEQGHSHSHAHIIIPIKEPVHLTHDGMSYYLMPVSYTHLTLPTILLV